MGRAPCCEKEGLLKKGAWTAEEDEKLVSFIRRNNGHGSWRTLPQLAGLQRCGKSCRLRWTNYLRPNIKRGGFTADEEWTITQLHALLGNKWSSIAARLPGRTDNEVKNHWNTHLKKRLSRIGIDPVTHRPVSLSDLVNFNNPSVIKDDKLMKHRRHSYSNSSSFNCTNPQSHKRELPRVSVVDQSYVSHMAQWELARLEAEGRQMRGKASAASSMSEPASSGGVIIRQAWTHTDRGQAGKEDELWEVMLGELLEVPHELGAGPPSGPVSLAHDMTSHSSSSAGSHEFLKEVDITSSDLTCLIHHWSPQAVSLSPSPGPYSPHEPLLALVPASPGLLPPCEPVYLANMHSLIGTVISSCHC